MSVIVGCDFPDVLMLDVDDTNLWVIRNGDIARRAKGISDRFGLGDCLIVLSSAKSFSLNFHLIFDAIMPWTTIHRLLITLAKEGEIDRNIIRLRYGRGDFTTRLSPDRANGRMMPFPVGYVKGYRISGGRLGDKRGGGIKKWLDAWKIAKKISHISNNSLSGPRIARES